MCPSGEVVEMKSALFGLMKLGRCADESFGYLGCSADILSQMDMKCSGKLSCEIPVATITAQANCTIPKTISKYLEAQYGCKKGKYENKLV